MTAPQSPAPGQPPSTQAPVVAPAPDPAAAPVPAPSDATAPWPPDEATMLALQMDARFSVIEEPGESAPTPVPAPPTPAPQAAQAPPVKE